MDKYLASTMSWPDWAEPGSHYYNMRVNELWLKGKQYDHIQYPFCRETDASGSFLKHYEKRPSVRLQLPAICADFVSRKLFATSHAPIPKHRKPKVLEAIKWLIKTAKINRRMIEASFWGQAGSVALIPKVVNGKPCVKVWNGMRCIPHFQEDDSLDYLQIVQPVKGAHFQLLAFPVPKDCKDEPIDPEQTYWYVREWNQQMLVTCLPIPEDLWNPESGDPQYLKFILGSEQANPIAPRTPALWLRNLDGGDNCDGRATFDTVKSNCVDLDLNLSQMSRGLKFASAPTVIIKGRVLNVDRHSGQLNVGPSNAINLPADTKQGPNVETSGADVKLLEMKADAVRHGMETFVSKVKMWSQEMMAMGRKDPDTIKGDLSGTAMKLIDAETIDMVQSMQTSYGDEGMLELIVILALILIKMGHAKFAGITEGDLEELTLEYPNLYEATPQEQLYIAQSIQTAIEAGIQEVQEGRRTYETQIGKTSDMINAIQDEIADLSSKDDTPGTDVSVGTEAPPQGQELARKGKPNAKTV